MNARAPTASPVADRPVSNEALTVVGSILAAVTFILMLAIVWFRFCDTREIR